MAPLVRPLKLFLPISTLCLYLFLPPYHQNTYGSGIYRSRRFDKGGDCDGVRSGVRSVLTGEVRGAEIRRHATRLRGGVDVMPKDDNWVRKFGTYSWTQNMQELQL
eukprot:57639-Amorphochlora_amoeboformis.AAC.2